MQNLTREEIPEAVARALGWEKIRYRGYWFWREDCGRESRLIYSVNINHSRCKLFDPYINHDQFHAIMTPERWAKVCDVLDERFTDWDVYAECFDYYWHNPKYQSDRRLWELRALVEVLQP